METKTHWKKVFDSDYLGACDLENDKDVKVIIKSVEVRKIKGQNGTEEGRNIAIFTDPKIKPMVLNATNCKQLRKFTNTPFIQDWKNVPIQIYVKKDIKAFGDITEGLRIRDIQPQLSKPELKPETEAWAGAVTFLKGTGTIERIKEKYIITPALEEQLKNEIL